MADAEGALLPTIQVLTQKRTMGLSKRTKFYPKACSYCGKTPTILYTPSGFFCSERCIADGLYQAKRKTYDHLKSIGLGLREGESREEWLERVKKAAFEKVKRLKLHVPRGI